MVEALGIAWRMVAGDFLQLWLLTLIPVAVMFVVAVLGGAIPCFGTLITILMLFLVKPQLLAGYFAALTREVDGEPLDFNDLFAGYRERFVQSMVAMLPVYGIVLVFLVLVSMLLGVSTFGMALLTGASHDAAPAFFISGVGMLAALATLLFYVGVLALVIFLPLTIWDRGESGWDAFAGAVQLSVSRIGQVLGLAVLSALILLVAAIVGTLLLCVGTIVTVPLATAWVSLAVILLYRGWTGREDAPAIPRPVAPAPPPPAPPAPPPEAPPAGTPPGPGAGS